MTTTQLGNQGIYHKGWTAGTTPVALPWVGAEIDVDPIDGYEWELYNVEEDPTQSNNIVSLVRSFWMRWFDYGIGGVKWHEYIYTCTARSPVHV